MSTWTNVPGQLISIAPGDFAGLGKAGIAGLAADDSIWYTADLSSWNQIPGQLQSLVTGDFNGDLITDIAGLATDGSIWYTTDLQTWNQIPGNLKQLVAGNFTGSQDSLAGVASDGSIWYTEDLTTWQSIPGDLSGLAAYVNPIPPTTIPSQLCSPWIAADNAAKPLLLDFSASWCPACQYIDEYIWPDATIAPIVAADYYFFKVDNTNDAYDDLMGTYDIQYYPTVIVLGLDGSTLGSFVPWETTFDAYVSDFAAFLTNTASLASETANASGCKNGPCPAN
jgi:thiol-disulfide isomerase/thioredoxin